MKLQTHHDPSGPYQRLSDDLIVMVCPISDRQMSVLIFDPELFYPIFYRHVLDPTSD